VVWSFVYLALCRLVQLVVLLCRSERSKELEILVLRHELAIMRRQPRRARLRPVDRAILAAFARALPRSAWTSLSVSPTTLLRWHRQLVRRRWTYPHRRSGRPALDRRLITVIRTPVQAPNANAHAERWVGSVRRECLDRLLIFSRRQLEHVLRTYTDHYNRHRPHRSLALRPPERSSMSPTPLPAPPYPQLNCTDLLGGLIHEYERAA
jgi:transposase InsO family protein